VFFSNEYVFDGAAGPYAEDAPTNPPNVYGRHKLEAERLIAATLQDYLIVRVCGVYGFERQGKNFVMALLARERRGEPMNVPSDQWGTPTYGDNLAAAVKELSVAVATWVPLAYRVRVSPMQSTRIWLVAAPWLIPFTCGI
jgi:dTDP-4-dehydrorhamnose reductase